MTNAEFKKQFNTLYNNINNNAAPGLSDAEISIFLNKAQDEIVKSHVLGPTTTYQVGINQMSKRDVELESLIKTVEYEPSDTVPIIYPIHQNGGVIFKFKVEQGQNPPKVLVVLSETVVPAKLDDNQNTQFGEQLDVVELSYTQFNRFISGVYKYPKKNQCWKYRHDGEVELVFPTNVYSTYGDSNYEHFRYTMVYVKVPQQIKIANDTSNVECELPEVLHPEILQRAVELAKAAYASETLSMQMSMGKRSE